MVNLLACAPIAFIAAAVIGRRIETYRHRLIPHVGCFSVHPWPDPVLDFWFDFASTYSYLAAARIRPLAADANVRCALGPFLLGPIFKAQGWDTSPFNLYEAKGRYMWRDMERLAAGLNLPFRRPDPFPQNSLLPARVALFGLTQGWGEDFSVAVFHGAVRRGRPDRRAAHPRGNPDAHERRCAGRARSRAIRRHQASPRSRSKRRNSSAFSARRASPPRTANCSGATTGWSRRSPGRPRR